MRSREMDSVMMTSQGSGTRLRSRLRAAATPFHAKHHNHHTYPKISRQAPSAPMAPLAPSAPSRHRAAACVFGPAAPRPPEPSDQEMQDPSCRLSGRISREALQAWAGRVGQRQQRAPADTLQPLFSDLHLYPSKTQVFEMLVCARQCSRPGTHTLSLSFGEFCLFAAQLRRHAHNRLLSTRPEDANLPLAPCIDDQIISSNDAKTCRNVPVQNGVGVEAHPYEVFLGGSCNPTTWRCDVAIPTLQKMGITYFNPQVEDWSLELIEIEHRAKQSARVLFFVLDAETRAAAAAVEAAHLAAAARPLVLVLQPYRRGQHISGEPVSDQEYLDLSRGQAILQEVAERRELPVFSELAAALCCTQLLLRGAAPARPPPSTAIANHLMKLKRAFDAADDTKSGFLTLEQTSSAIRSFTGMDITVYQVGGLVRALAMPRNDTESSPPPIKRTSSSLNGISVHAVNGEKPESSVDFELFCSVLAEIMADVTNGTEDAIMSSPDIDDNERRIKQLIKLEARTLLDSVDTPTLEDSTKATLQCDTISKSLKYTDSITIQSAAISKSLQNMDHITIQSDTISKSLQNTNTTAQKDEISNSSRNSDSIKASESSESLDRHSIVVDSPECGNENARRREPAAKWRQLFHCVQAAILGFVSKLEFNAVTRSNSMNGHQDPVSPGAQKCGTTYARRREMEGASKHKHRSSLDAGSDEDSISPSPSPEDATVPTTTNGKPAKKLSVFIPKVTIGSGTDAGTAVLTPQTTRRLDGLAESVKNEPVSMRDVYLGGSCVVRTNWREEKVIPILEQYNFTYYVPAMNDYSRMFSAPPYTPANGGKFTFDGVSARNGSKMLRVHGDKVLRSQSAQEARKNEEDAFAEEVGDPRPSSEESRGPHKHERSPAPEGNLPEKRPKYSRNSSDEPSHDEDVEVRHKSTEGPYPLHSGGDNRLSASDFYRIPENASPAPFRGMYDERQVWGSRVLLFGVTRDTRCLAPMVLAAHCLGLRPRALVLCVQLLDQPQGLSERAVKDYNRGRLYLIDLAKREGVPVFDNLEEAAECVVRKLQTKDY